MGRKAGLRDCLMQPKKTYQVLVVPVIFIFNDVTTKKFQAKNLCHWQENHFEAIHLLWLLLPHPLLALRLYSK